MDFRQKLLKLTSASILVMGLASACLIYTTAEDEPPAAVGYRLINGVVQPIPPSESKSYQRDLRLYGGTMAVLADEMGNWLAGLWRGKRLAWTVAVLTVIASGGVFLAARHALPLPASRADETANPDGES